MKLLKIINKAQNGCFLWILLSVITFGLVFFAHYFFQKYLFMQPCEQCVYIRFAMIILGISGIFGVIYPRDFNKIIAYSLGFYGCIIGIGFCIKLNALYEAVHNQDAFGGVLGCRKVPIFPFNLPLHEWSKSLFLPTGECGFDSPIIPENMYENLSKTQEFFVGSLDGDFKNGLYSNGWYLVPSLKFMNMATACLICFICCFLALFLMVLGFGFGGDKKLKKILIVVFLTAFLLIFDKI